MGRGEERRAREGRGEEGRGRDEAEWRHGDLPSLW